MSDSFKGIRNRHKVATMPIPGTLWDGIPPMAQLALLVMESAKFMAAMHQQEVAGFQIVVVREGKDAEVVLAVGAPEEKNSGLIVPERQLIMPN